MADAAEKARVERELAAADIELELGLDKLTPAGVAKTLLVLESIGGQIADPSLAAWLDVLRCILRRAKLAGRGAVFLEETAAAPAPDPAPPGS